MTKKHIIIASLIFFTAFLVYGITSGTTVSFGDSGEFISGGYNLNLLHPPGYPLYSITGKIFTLILPGNIAFRINMMSAFWGSLTLVFLYLIIIQLEGNIPSALAGTTSLLFANTFWHYSHYAKGYSLNLFFLSLLIFCALKYKENSRWIYMWGIIFGLSCSYHYQSMIILLPAFLYIFFATKKPLAKEILITLALVIPGLLLYLFLPLRALASPEFYHWGNPTTLAGFTEIVTGKIYGWHEATSRTGLENTLKQLLMYLQFLLKEFNPLGIIAGLAGIIILAWRNFKIFIFTLLIYLINVLAVSYFITTQADMFLEVILPGLFLPSHLILAIWTGIAAYGAGEKFKKPVITYLFFLIPLISLIINYPANYERNNYMAYDFARNCLITPEENSLLITSGDNDTFPLWYCQQVEKLRPDVKLITMGLVGEKNYGEYLREVEKIPWEQEFSAGLRPEDAISIFIKRNRDLKIYVTFHAAAKLPSDLILAPRGLLYELTEPDNKNDLLICSELVERKYSLRGLTDKKVHKDFLTSSMLGPYAKAFYDIGIMYLNENQKDRAIKSFEFIEAIDYGYRSDIKEEFQTFIDFQMAMIALEEKNWNKVLELLENKEENFKNNIDFYLTRGVAYRETGNYQKSLEDLSRAADMSPKSARINLELARLYYEANDIQQAIYKFTIALQLRNDIPEGHYWLGKAYEKYKLYDRAIEKYKEELTLYPDHKPSEDALKILINSTD